MALKDVGESLSIYVKKKRFRKREIYHCHYVTPGYHSNGLSSIIMSLERVVSKEQVRRHTFQCTVSVL
jgi:hypothetical protein